MIDNVWFSLSSSWLWRKMLHACSSHHTQLQRQSRRSEAGMSMQTHFNMQGKGFVFVCMQAGWAMHENKNVYSLILWNCMPLCMHRMFFLCVSLLASTDACMQMHDSPDNFHASITTQAHACACFIPTRCIIARQLRR